MSSSLPAGSTTKTATTARSLFALALRAWNLCVLLVVVAALVLVSPAAVVILFPVACMSLSLPPLRDHSSDPLPSLCRPTGQVMSTGAACASGSKTAPRSTAPRRPAASTTTTLPLRKRGARGTGPSKNTARRVSGPWMKRSPIVATASNNNAGFTSSTQAATTEPFMIYWLSGEVWREATGRGVRNAQIYKVN
ncbi:unnamed protein product [Urochloa decumbens]|uniref:Uncharacterized protein n=1 Tax=Urochloa decumbens TaxID=240449 RepID=A0ABC9FDX8_9POAL